MTHPTLLSQGLDYYKATMSQVEFEHIPDTTVTFELKNRSSARLSDYCPPEQLAEHLADRQRGWQPEEIAYLASLTNQVRGDAQFDADYLDYLADSELPPVEIGLDERGDLAVRTTGSAPLVTFWETVVMSEINEIYFQNKLAQEGLSLRDLYRTGDQRLSEKIDLLHKRPDIKFSDFGTRRHFSYGWQKHVVERIAHELPENFLGTSNIYLARELGLRPIGTFAHELPMIYSALADQETGQPLLGHNRVLQNWQQLYSGDLSIALTDTYGSEFFFADMTPEQAREWQGLRHDSGDPFDFGDRAIDFYQAHDIDPQAKTVVFSDGLDIDRIVQLADYFQDKVGLVFGWGTTLTNDLGVKPNNFVMKAVEANGRPTVKLSDVQGKHTGPEALVARYERERDAATHMGAAAWQEHVRAQYAAVA